MKLIEIYNYETNKVIDTLKIKKEKNIQKDVIEYLKNKNYSIMLQGSIGINGNNIYWLAHNKLTSENLKIWYREKDFVKDFSTNNELFNDEELLQL